MIGRPAAAQWQVGSSHSPKGLGLYVERQDAAREISRGAFTLDFDGILSGETRRPGFRISYEKLFLTPLYRLPDNTQVDFCYGPGLVGGVVRDGDFQGPMAALCGSLGVRFTFPERPFAVGLSWGLDLGIHLQRVEGENTNLLRFYRPGVLRCWLPSLTLSYRFP